MVKRCLVLGSANSLNADVQRAVKMVMFHGVVAAKDAGIWWPYELDGWVSLHPERMAQARKDRSAKGFPDAKVHFGHQYREGIDGIDVWTEYKFEGQKRSGSSGLFAAKIALDYFHFDQVVLCGMPLQKDQGRIDGKEHWNGGISFHQGFLEAIPAFKDRVRSMSGWTALQVGTPTLDWLLQR